MAGLFEGNRTRVVELSCRALTFRRSRPIPITIDQRHGGLHLPEEEKKAQRQALVEGPIPFYLTRLLQRLEAHGGQYFAADRLSVADLKVFTWFRQLKSGALDHVPTDLPDRVAPKLVEHYERVKNDPRVLAYYAKHSITS